MMNWNELTPARLFNFSRKGRCSGADGALDGAHTLSWCSGTDASSRKLGKVFSGFGGATLRRPQLRALLLLYVSEVSRPVKNIKRYTFKNEVGFFSRQDNFSSSTVRNECCFSTQGNWFRATQAAMHSTGSNCSLMSLQWNKFTAGTASHSSARRLHHRTLLEWDHVLFS